MVQSDGVGFSDANACNCRLITRESYLSVDLTVRDSDLQRVSDSLRSEATIDIRLAQLARVAISKAKSNCLQVSTLWSLHDQVRKFSALQFINRPREIVLAWPLEV